MPISWWQSFIHPGCFDSLFANNEDKQPGKTDDRQSKNWRIPFLGFGWTIWYADSVHLRLGPSRSNQICLVLAACYFYTNASGFSLNERLINFLEFSLMIVDFWIGTSSLTWGRAVFCGQYNWWTQSNPHTVWCATSSLVWLPLLPPNYTTRTLSCVFFLPIQPTDWMGFKHFIWFNKKDSTSLQCYWILFYMFRHQ